MAENSPISFSFAGLPAEYCFTGFNRFALDIVAQMAGFVPGAYNFFNYGNDEPAVNDRTKPWLRLNPDGTFDKVYVFAGGLWVSPHPVPASSAMRMWWTDSEANLWAYDGGNGVDPSATAPTASTGAMWERDDDYDARFPLQAGVLPSTLALNVGDTGGEEKHVLLVAEIPKHTHYIASDEIVTGDSGLNATDNVARRKNAAGNAEGSYNLAASTVDATMGKSGPYGGDAAGATTGHNTLPPYRVGMWAKRTARTSYTP